MEGDPYPVSHVRQPLRLEMLVEPFSRDKQFPERASFYCADPSEICTGEELLRSLVCSENSLPYVFIADLVKTLLNTEGDWACLDNLKLKEDILALMNAHAAARRLKEDGLIQAVQAHGEGLSEWEQKNAKDLIPSRLVWEKQLPD